MFGSLGFPEILFILILALLIFGPRKLPEIGRTIGRSLAEFRKASTDLKRSLNAEMIEEEMRQSDPRKILDDVDALGGSPNTTRGDAMPEREPAPASSGEAGATEADDAETADAEADDAQATETTVPRGSIPRGDAGDVAAAPISEPAEPEAQ